MLNRAAVTTHDHAIRPPYSCGPTPDRYAACAAIHLPFAPPVPAPNQPNASSVELPFGGGPTTMNAPWSLDSRLLSDGRPMLPRARSPQADTPPPWPPVSPAASVEESSDEILRKVPQTGLPFIAAIERGLATGPAAIDGFTSDLITSVTRYLGNEIDALNARNAELQTALDSRRDELEDARRYVAVLTERLDSEGGNKHLRHLGVAVGTSMATAGTFGDFANSPAGLSVSLIVGGIALALAFWIIPRRNRGTNRNGSSS